MKASVIVIVYNEEDNIGNCISSILKQSYPRFELIVVDDGSTDRTGDIVKQFNDKRIVYTRHPKNKGYASARNTGLKLACGKFVFFTDADCIADKDWIRNGLRFMEHDPKLIAASGDVKGVPIHKESMSLSDGSSCIRPMLSYIYYFPSTINSVYSHAWIEKSGGFDERYNHGFEDTDVGLKAVKSGKVVHNPDMIVAHKAKAISLKRGLSIFRRYGVRVCLIKDHGKDYPLLRKSEFCYKFIVAPHYFWAMVFPPMMFFALKAKSKRLVSFKDIIFLIPFYFGLLYARFTIWKTAFKERVFLI